MCEGLDDATADFMTFILEDQKDALTVMVKMLQRRMMAESKDMKLADIKVIMKIIKDTSCLTL